MWRDFQSARPADAHAFDTIEQAADERPPIDPDVRDQRLALVLEPRGADASPGGLPTYSVSSVQPETETDAVMVLTTDWITGAWYIREQCQPGSQSLPQRRP